VRKLNKDVWPYQITIPKENLREVTLVKSIEDWCKEYIGRRFVHWYSYMNEQGVLYAFNDEATLLAFKLRWYYKG
jgi:hypothetical protein